MSRKLFSTLLVFIFSILSSNAFANRDVVVDVILSPAGSFKMKTDEVVGNAVQKGDLVTAENIVVKLNNIKTGISLRDRHAKEKYLETSKFPEAVLVKAEGQNGKGKGLIRIRGIEKEVAGEYVAQGGYLKAKFPLKVSDFGITGVKYMGVGVKDEIVINVSVPIVKSESK